MVLKSPIVVATVDRSDTDAVTALLIPVGVKVLSCMVLISMLEARFVEKALFTVEGVVALMTLWFDVLLVVEVVIDDVSVLGVVILLDVEGLLVGGLSFTDMVSVIPIDVVVRGVADVGFFESSLKKLGMNILILVVI